MEIELTENGWKEITTKYVKVKAIGRSLMTVEKWIASNRRLGFERRNRKSCNMCKTKWEDLKPTGGVNLIFTNVENKMICDGCVKTLQRERDKQKKAKRYKALEL